MEPNFIHELWLRIRTVAKRRQLDKDLAEELEFHLSMRQQKFVEAGMPVAEARRQAGRGFGNAIAIKEAIRTQWSFPSLESLWQDVRFGLRQIRRNLGFATLAIVTLAVGVGATTAIFDVVYCAVLHPLPYKDADRCVVLVSHDPAQPRWDHWLEVTPSEYFDIQEQNQVFDKLIGAFPKSMLLTGNGLAPDMFSAMAIDPETFGVMGMKPMLGRVFTSADNQSGASTVVVLSNDAWQKKFGRDRNIIGKNVLLDHQSATVVGVMPPHIGWPAFPDGWVPGLPPRSDKSGTLMSFVAGHIKPGLTFEQASAALLVLSRRLAKAYPEQHPKELMYGVQTLTDACANAQTTRTLTLLMGGVGLLLLIACVNVSNMLLARATVREKEFAVRMALGAARNRVIRQLLVESLLMGATGASLGIALAWITMKGFKALVPAWYLPGEAEIRMHPPVLVIAAGVALLATLLSGLAPAWFAARKDIQTGMKTKSQGEMRTHTFFRNLLVVSEVAFSLVLLTGAALLLRSFWDLQHIHLGYRVESVLDVVAPLPDARYGTAEQRNRFHLEELRHIRAIPGVTSASLGWPPMNWVQMIKVEIPSLSNSEPLRTGFRVVGDGFFSEFGIPLLVGRAISEEDLNDARHVVVVNRSFARTYLAGRNAIGTQIKLLFPSAFAPKQTVFEIVGVAEDTYHLDGDDPKQVPQIYVPDTSFGFGWDLVFARTAPGLTGVDNTIRKELARIDSELPVQVHPAMEDFKGWYEEPGFILGMNGAFAVVGLTLVCVGVYGVLSYSVSQRRHEIGVRMALGARSRDVRLLVLKSGLTSVLIGIAIGTPTSLLLTRILQNRIWGIKTADPLNLAAVAVVTVAVGMIASYSPARRATKVDPLETLRCE